MREFYTTVFKEASVEISEKKSRFIANVKNINSEDEAIAYLEDMKKKYWNATHNVYAYYIGGECAAQKCSDDGEPSGTAGMPILQTIKKEEIEDVIVVVTRYFGGTLLGTGGLIRAYSKCAKEGIIAGGVKRKILCSKINIKVDYTLLDRLQSLIAESGYQVIGIDYSDFVNIFMAIPINSIHRFNKQICELTSGRTSINEIDRGYYIVEEVS